MIPIKTPKKLIEVALPLDAINAAAAREPSAQKPDRVVIGIDLNLREPIRRARSPC